MGSKPNRGLDGARNPRGLKGASEPPIMQHYWTFCDADMRCGCVAFISNYRTDRTNPFGAHRHEKSVVGCARVIGTALSMGNEGKGSMAVALYADYIADLRALFTELDRRPEKFQTFNVRLELAAAGSVIVYETRRGKGQIDSLYYGRSADTGTNQKITQSAAFNAIDRFFALGQFIALTDQSDSRGASDRLHTAAVNAQYPHCAVNFSYRKKGQPVTRAMLMIFIGFNDEADASEYVSTNSDIAVLEDQRPYRSARLHEWK